MYTLRIIFDASAIICALVFLRLLCGGRNRNKASLPLPPGPKGLPLIGNYLDIEAEMWEAARKWGQQYGKPTFWLYHECTCLIFENIKALGAHQQLRNVIYFLELLPCRC